MKRNIEYWIRVLIILLLFSLIVAFASYSSNNTRIEVMEKNDDGLNLEFSSLSESINHQIVLDNSNVLLVESRTDHGTIRLSVTSQQGDVIYTGSLKKTLNFTLNVKKPSQYSIVVDGNKSSGSIRIQKRQKE